MQTVWKNCLKKYRLWTGMLSNQKKSRKAEENLILVFEGIRETWEGRMGCSHQRKQNWK